MVFWIVARLQKNHAPLKDGSAHVQKCLSQGLADDNGHQCARLLPFVETQSIHSSITTLKIKTDNVSWNKNLHGTLSQWFSKTKNLNLILRSPTSDSSVRLWMWGMSCLLHAKPANQTSRSSRDFSSWSGTWHGLLTSGSCPRQISVNFK